MKYLKRIIALVLCMVFTVSMLAGCAETQPNAVPSTDVATTEKTEDTTDVVVPPVIIACGWNSIGEQELLQQQYYEEVLAPGLNIEFIFSSNLSSDEEIVDFLENASAQGAVGFLDMASSSNDSANIIAEKCDELGMYNASWMTSVTTDSEYFVGMASADGQYMSTAFYEILVDALSADDKGHSMVIFSTGAQYYIPKHLFTTMGALSAFNDVYDLGWTQDEMMAFATTNSRLHIDTGRDDVKVCVEPAMQALNEVCSEHLKNGDYDIFVATDSFYLQLTTSIAEAEQALGKDISVFCNSNIVSATQTAFDTLDPFGKSSLDQAMLKSSANGVVLMALLLNGVYGEREAVYTEDGNYMLYNIRFMRASSAEDYARIAMIDHDGNWMFSLDDFKQMLKPYNENLTAEWLQEYIHENVSFESVMERLGI